MEKVLLINADEPEEVRVALLEDGRLEELYVEAGTDSTAKGNIYVGRVQNVERGIGAAFVDLGPGLTGFLHASDIARPVVPGSEEDDDESDGGEGEDAVEEGGAGAGGAEPSRGEADAEAARSDLAEVERMLAPEPDSEALGAVPIAPEADAFDAASTASEPAADVAAPVAGEAAPAPAGKRPRRGRGKPIDELVKPGDFLLVQITRGPLGNKGPALTTRISLPGRYVVLLANSRRSGVSRRIDSGAERDRMRSILSGLELPAGMAVILRTASHGRTRAEVQADVASLVDLWRTMERRLHDTGGPRLVHAESDLVMRAIRDILPVDATRVVVDDEAAAARVEELLRRMTPPPAPEPLSEEPGADAAVAALDASPPAAEPPPRSGAPAPVAPPTEAPASAIGPEADPDDEESVGAEPAAAAASPPEPGRSRRSRRDRRASREAPVAWSPPRIERHMGPGPLFHAFGVESQVEDAYRRTIRLPSGGSIVIDPTEALVAIDVNSGRLTEEEDLESTAWKTDLEAVPEVARQLRLRDLGGVIVIDFIDLREPAHVHEVERTLREALKRDRARVRLGRMGPFGCLELTRQRIRPALASVTHVSCPACGGTGRRRHPMGLALRVLREIRARIARTRGQGGLEVRAAPPVVDLLRKRKAGALSDVERALAGPLRLVPDPTLGQAGWAMKGIPPKPVHGGSPASPPRVP